MDSKHLHPGSSGDVVDPMLADLTSALARTKNPEFARDHNVLQPQVAPFRRLSWKEIAVQIPLELKQIEDSTEELRAPVEQDLPTADAENPMQEAPPTQAVQEAHKAFESPVTEDFLEPKPACPVEPAIDEAMIKRIREDAYAEGLSAGKAITENEREAELAAQYTQLQQLMSSLSSDKVIDMDIVTHSIKNAVLSLASDRIGIELADMPEPLLMRLDSLLNNLSHLIGKREVYVSPDDVPLLQKFLDNQPNPPLIHLQSEPALLRGDARVRIGGAEVTDLLRDRARHFFSEDTPEVL